MKPNATCIIAVALLSASSLAELNTKAAEKEYPRGRTDYSRNDVHPYYSFVESKFLLRDLIAKQAECIKGDSFKMDDAR